MNMERRAYDIDPGNGINTSIYHCNDGFSYYVHGKVANEEYGMGTTYLRCCQYFTPTRCSGRAILYKTPEGEVWNNSQDHGCTPDVLASSLRHFRYELLHACRTQPYEIPRDLLFRVSLRYPERVLDRVDTHNIRKAMYNARLNLYPVAPDDLTDLGAILGDPQHSQLTQTINGNDMLYAGTVGPPGHRSTIFFSRRMRKFCGRNIKEVFADATFVPTPVKPHGAQVYQIVTVIRDKVIPLVQAIMEDKSYEAYVAVLRAVKALAPQLRPRVAMMDYERNPIRAWRTVFGCTVRGCYFHYVKAVLKKMKSLGLKDLMENDSRIRSVLRSFLAIPLLPKDLILRAVFVLIKSVFKLDILLDVADFLLYFMRTWLNGYRFETLSVYGQPHRTNNATEAANRILRIETGPHHPGIWHFINSIKKYEWFGYRMSRKAFRGKSLGRRARLATLNNNRVIENCSEDLLNGHMSIRRFLRVTSTRVLNVFHSSLRIRVNP